MDTKTLCEEYGIKPSFNQPKIDNAIEIIEKYLKEIPFTPEQRQLFTDFIDYLQTVKVQECINNFVTGESELNRIYNDIIHRCNSLLSFAKTSRDLSRIQSVLYLVTKNHVKHVISYDNDAIEELYYDEVADD